MDIVDKALQTQLQNIQVRSGKTFDELFTLLRTSGLEKHGQLRDFLKRELGMGHGDANTVVHFYLKDGDSVAVAAGSAAGKKAGKSKAAAPVVSTTVGREVGPEVLDGIYTGAKAALRPIHDAVMKQILKFGPFEIAPKKTYLSLRRKKQFVMVGPATNTRVEVGLNMKGLDPTARLIANPPGGMCQYKVKLTSADEVDRELIGWIRQAYDAAE